MENSAVRIKVSWADSAHVVGSHGPALRLCFGLCEIDVMGHLLFFDGKERHLEPRAFAVLLYLVAHRGRVISKAELLESLWPTRHVTENVVARCVMKVRHSLGDTTPCGALIRTLHRVGYRFDAEVSESLEPRPRALVSDGRQIGSDGAVMQGLSEIRMRR